MARAICKHEGCANPVNGRGMCRNHYAQWQRRNPGVTVMASTDDTVLEAMPGTVPQLIERTGMRWNTVMRALERLTKGGPNKRAFIYGHQPPTSRGQRWLAKYMQGNKANVKLTDEMKAEHRRKMSRAADKRRKDVTHPNRKKQRMAPPAPAPWLGPLLAMAA